MSSPILTVDISQWRRGGDAAEALCRAVDESLQTAGFLLVTGHGIDPALPADLRAAARRFFALPTDVKSRYAVAVGGRGWIGPGMEANGSADGSETPPDLKESFSVGADEATADLDGAPLTMAEGKKIVTEAKETAVAEANRIIAAAHAQIEAERQAAFVSLRSEVGTLAIDLAGKVVGETLDDDARATAVVDRFLADLEKAK